MTEALTSTLCKRQKYSKMLSAIFQSSTTIQSPRLSGCEESWKEAKLYLRVSNFINRHHPVAKTMSDSASSLSVRSDILTKLHFLV